MIVGKKYEKQGHKITSITYTIEYEGRRYKTTYPERVPVRECLERQGMDPYIASTYEGTIMYDFNKMNGYKSESELIIERVKKILKKRG